MTKEHLNYKDIIEIMEKVIDKIILSKGALKRKHLSKYERECVRLFINQSLTEKDVILDKFRLFFFTTGNI